ncbi:hypothetical protein [Paenibacillus amylolyticus]|uniref:Uncharacterized protein n=1 Tax=Paenibacillus amylolyticus TaxID=1451 RepID=A0ABD8B2V9_PAEAM
MYLAYIPEDSGNDSVDPNAQYLDQLKKVYVVDPNAVDTVNWVLVFAGTIGTIIFVVAIVGWIYTFVLYMASVSLGRASLKNKKFWIQMVGSLFVIIFYSTGVLFAFGSEMYKLLQSWGTL